MPKPINSIDYKDLAENFPLKGQYIFRARFKQGKEILWYDLEKNATKIPSEDGAIYLKVKRVSWEPANPGTPAPSLQSQRQPHSATSVPRNQPAQEFNLESLGENPIPTSQPKTQPRPVDDHFDLSGFGKPSPTVQKPKPAAGRDMLELDLDLDLSGLGGSNPKPLTKPRAMGGLGMDDLLL